MNVTRASMNEASNSKMLKKILFSMVSVGSILSLCFWAPSTIYVIKEYGVRTAIHSTHLLRIIIDLLTLAAALIALSDMNK
jgi:hypothetical protein